MFSNMDLETMVTVLKPKVDGSRYLDECFPEDTLDFFIMFGSLASVLGNSGQVSSKAHLRHWIFFQGCFSNGSRVITMRQICS